MKKPGNRMRLVFMDFVKNPQIYLLMLPGMFFMLIFSYFPMIGYVLAFKNYNMLKGIFGSPNAGLANFRFFFSNKEWLNITWNTLYLNTLFIVFGMGTAVFVAIILNELRISWLKKLTQSVVFLPYFVSWLVVDRMVYSLLATDTGIVNQLLRMLGLEKIPFYSRAEYWRPILTIVYMIKNSGYYSVIFIGSISSIDPTYYESALIDGASRVQMITRITLPLIRNTILVMVLLAVGRIFYGDFGMIYGIIGDNSTLYRTVDVIDTYSFRALRNLGSFSMSSAITLYQSLVGVITVMLFNWVARKIDPETRLF